MQSKSQKQQLEPANSSKITSFPAIKIPITVVNEEDGFIGRSNEVRRFSNDMAIYEKGAYLVTGYRGVGKTCFVKEALAKTRAKLAEQNEHLEVVSFSLGIGGIDIRDLLWDLNALLNDERLEILLRSIQAEQSEKAEKFSVRANFFEVLKGKGQQSEKVKTSKNEATIRQIETALIKCINEWNDCSASLLCKIKDTRSKSRKTKFIFVFDEMDKMSSFRTKDKTKPSGNDAMNQLLGSMKRIFSETNALFVFIAGRDILDTYHSEVGNTNALYEHIFKKIYYLPSLLRDTSLGKEVRLSRMLEQYVYFRITGRYSAVKDQSPLKELFRVFSEHLVDDDGTKAENAILVLRNFCNFLTFHTWGNFNKIIKLFSNFLRVREFDEDLEVPDAHGFLSLESYPNMEGKLAELPKSKCNNQQYYLLFDLKAMHRIMLASNLYTLFYQGIGRQLTKADDKLVVSSFILFHHILKLHDVGFSRKHIEIASEAISKSNVPHLTAVGEAIVNVVLYPFIRVSFGGIQQFRFFHHFQQELVYLSSLDEMEMATFNFSKEGYAGVRSYYQNLFQVYCEDFGHQEDHQGVMTKAKIQEIIGDFSLWNKHLDEAFICYGGANTSLYHIYGKETAQSYQYPNLQYLIEVQLKQGYLEELRGDYPAAENFYLQLEDLVSKFIENVDPFKRQEIIQNKNKFHMLRNCFLARIYLNVKRASSNPVEESAIALKVKNVLFLNSPYLQYKLGNANFYSLHLDAALKQFVKAYNMSDSSQYLRACAGIRICQTIIILRLNRANSIDDVVELLMTESQPIQVSDKLNNKMLASYSLTEILRLLLHQSQSLSNIGLHTQSAHALLCYTTVLVLLIESIPWGNDAANDDKLKEMAVKIEALADALNPLMADENMKSYQGAFSMFRSSFYREYVCAKDAPMTFSRNIAYSHTGMEAVQLLEKQAYVSWQVSPLGETFMQFKFWIVRAKQIVEKCVSNIEQAKVLPQGAWAYAMSLWCSGRNLSKQVINQQNMTYGHRRTALSAIYYLSKSISYLKIISDNDRHLILPSVSQISYNIWELLYHLVRIKLTVLKSRQQRRKAQQKQKENEQPPDLYTQAVSLVERAFKTADVGAFSISFLNLDYAYQITSHYLEEAVLLVKPAADVRNEILRNKHYIDDDFEDPTFGMFWMYLCAFKAGAKLHQDTMDCKMTALRSLSQENEVEGKKQ